MNKAGLKLRVKGGDLKLTFLQESITGLRLDLEKEGLEPRSLFIETHDFIGLKDLSNAIMEIYHYIVLKNYVREEG